LDVKFAIKGDKEIQCDKDKYCFKCECPEGCVCLDKETAYKYDLEKLCGGEETICGESSAGPKYCWQGYECPKSCACLTEKEAEEKGLELCNGKKTVCGESDGLLKFCFAEKVCPKDCVCLTKEEAEKKGYTEMCSDNVCGYESTTATTAPTPKYCYKEGCVPLCPVNCKCLTEEEAKKVFNCPEKCRDTRCGSKTVDGTEVSMYCYKETCNATVLCPVGCECMTEEKAKELGYNVRCGNTECGNLKDNVVENTATRNSILAQKIVTV